MKCGRCSAAVKRILLQQPHVQEAEVNLLTGGDGGGPGGAASWSHAGGSRRESGRKHRQR